MCPMGWDGICMAVGGCGQVACRAKQLMSTVSGYIADAVYICMDLIHRSKKSLDREKLPDRSKSTATSP